MRNRVFHRSAAIALAGLLVATGFAADRPALTVPAIAEEAPPTGWDFTPATQRLMTLRDQVLHQAPVEKLPPSLAGAVGTGAYTGDDTCQYANDGECDDPGIGTGACRAGTDYSDCWRIATNAEDDSCRWANDGECDEPHFGTGACAQGTDRSDCGVVAFLRNQTDTCVNAMNGVCNEPGIGDGTCAARTDRADCIGRDRPLTISDHYFGHDDRVLLDMTEFPWDVVGMLVDDGGSCTATLIAPDVLITAAHCIETENGVNATAEFRTAFRGDGFHARANVIAYFQSPDRARDLRLGEESAGSDWALLRIDQPLGAKLGFVGARPLSGTYDEAEAVALDILQAGFSWDTGDHLSGNIGCHFIAIEDGNRVLHECDTTHGDSGSPFMVQDGDQYFVLATDSTFRTVPGQPVVNVATRSDGWIPYLEDFVSGRIGETNLVSGQRK